MIFIQKSFYDLYIEKAGIKNRSHLIRKQITDKNGHRKTVWVNPNQDQKKSGKGRFFNKEELENAALDKAYMDAINSGDMEKVQKMVMDRAEKMGFKDAIPEQGRGYKIRTTRPPKKTRTVYKCFYVDTQGKPSALFVDNNANLPMNVWLNANDTWHFKAANGNEYVPTMGNKTNKDAGSTGTSVKIPDEETRQKLIELGYLPKGSKAANITCVAYRPGWHGGDLPFFPQGGKKGNARYTSTGKDNKNFNPDLPETNYENVHRWNQVIFEIEVDADQDYTEIARNQPKARKKDGTVNEKKADLQYMPTGGFYQYTTNPRVKLQSGGKGDWFISGSIKIKRALSQEECNKILAENGMKPQEWENGDMDLSKLGYTTPDYDAAKKTLAPITYDDEGKIIPLSQRFNRNSDDIRKGWF